MYESVQKNDPKKWIGTTKNFAPDVLDHHFQIHSGVTGSIYTQFDVGQLTPAETWYPEQDVCKYVFGVYTVQGGPKK